MDLTFTIPDDKVNRAKTAILALYPNAEKKEDGTPKFTDAQWVKEILRRFIVQSVHRGEQVIARDQAMQSVAVDNTIAS